MAREKSQVVIIAAGTVGGIAANSVEKLLFLGSTCIYPRLAAQPIDENRLLTGPLEPTIQRYAIAKIAGVKLMRCPRATGIEPLLHTDAVFVLPVTTPGFDR